MSILAAVVVGIHVFVVAVLIANFVYLRTTRPPRTPFSESASLPTVSVLIPARNEASNLKRLLPSLLAQTYASLEIWVYDDRSLDDTAAVVRSFDDPRLHLVSGTPLPEGWLGKPHALHRLSQEATGDYYVFLDADTEVHDPNAVQHWSRQFAQRPERSLATGLPLLRGGAAWIVSLVPNAILTGLPWPLVRWGASPSLSALNGQFWMIDAATYHTYTPHAEVRNKVLEDVEIGRYMKRNGVTPYLWDVRQELTVYMYRTTRDAWHGFRKNAYLLMGGHPVAFVPLWLFYTLTFVVAPWVVPWLWASVFGLKAATDYWNGISVRISLLAPVSYLMGALIQLDSAWHHWTHNVSWKGRSVGNAEPSASSESAPDIS